MDRVRLPNRESADGSASLIMRIRRFATKLGILTDIQGYKDEIARYEGEVDIAARRKDPHEAGDRAERREPAVS